MTEFDVYLTTTMIGDVVEGSSGLVHNQQLLLATAAVGIDVVLVQQVACIRNEATKRRCVVDRCE
jgi:hypothetical protein